MNHMISVRGRARVACMRGLVGALAVLGIAQARADAMPANARLWIVHDSNTCWDGVAGHSSTCATSDQFGAGGGIALHTYSKPSGSWSTSFAQASADRVHSFVGGQDPGSLYISMRDTYTVHGASAGSFDLTVHLAAEGLASSVWWVGKYWLYAPSVTVKIGSFDASTSGAVLEQFRVIPFAPANTATWGIPPIITIGPYVSHVIAVSTSYTKSVQVGDIFELGFGVNSEGQVGDIDLRNTGVVSFDLPAGVWITSENGAIFGTPVPEPATALMMAAGLLGTLLAFGTAGTTRAAGSG